MSIEVMAEKSRLDPPRTAVSAMLGRLSKHRFIGFVLIVDLLSMWAIGLALLVRRGGAGESLLPIVTLICVPLLAAAVLQRIWAYTIPALRSFGRQARALLIAMTGAFVLVMGLYFVANVDIMEARGWLLRWAFFSGLTLLALRLITGRVVAEAERRGDLARRAVVVGGGKACEELLARLERTGERAIRILGLFDDRGAERSPDSIGRHRKIGTFEELEKYARENAVDLLIIALPSTAEERILHLLRKLWQLPVDVRIAAHDSKLKLSKRAYSYIGDVPFLAVFDRPLSDWDGAIKAMFDRVVASILLMALLPLFALIALAIRLESKGPVFFRQQRYGFNNNLINVFKFRSMYVEMSDHDNIRQATKSDPRVTKVGRFIRRTSLDELPQLINVLRGELSLVGPRPHAASTRAANRLYPDVVSGYFARHRMRPGITGWAQINGWRGETDTVEKIERRVEHDLYYIENWSLSLDLYILAMTPIALLTNRNAY